MLYTSYMRAHARSFEELKRPGDERAQGRRWVEPRSVRCARRRHVDRKGAAVEWLAAHADNELLCAVERRVEGITQGGHEDKGDDTRVTSLCAVSAKARVSSRGTLILYSSFGAARGAQDAPVVRPVFLLRESRAGVYG